MSRKQERLASLKAQAERVQRRKDALELRSRQFWLFKLTALFVSIFIVVILLSKIPWLAIAVAFAAIALFFRISSYHRKVDRSFLQYRALRQLKDAQIARIQLDWEAIPFVQPYDVHPDHPFNLDLDITGERSLHQLINTGVSLEGQQRLGDWLLGATPDIKTIRARQVLIRELTPLTLFRDKFMLKSLLTANYLHSPVEGEQLLLWLEQQSGTRVPASTLIIPTLLSALTLVALLLFLLGYTPLLFCIIPFLLSLGWYLWTRRNRGTLTVDASYLNITLKRLRVVFEFLEKYPYGTHLNLKRLCEPFFMNPDHRPSILMRQLSRLAKAATVENMGLVGMFVNGLVPLDIYVVYFLARYRERAAKLLPLWLEIWYELEALSSLANFAYLNPDYVTPELIVDKKQPTAFRAKGLGHPLLADEKKVVNDFAFSSPQEIMLITGSNMAGKSTFLRTIGINLILAYAGGPVNATSLQTSLFEIYACIKVSDSVTDGYSYFYAEVRRLKELLTRLQEGTDYPVFFFIDEIFKGTNNRERLIGSISYIQAIAAKNCVGAVSTHDLELVKLSETLPQIQNYHFREDIIDGKMVFAYKLRHGPSPTTNALRIMQLEGLPVNYQADLSRKDAAPGPLQK